MKAKINNFVTPKNNDQISSKFNNYYREFNRYKENCYKCYNKDIYKLNPDTIFANADTEITNPAFCADIVNDAYINNKSLYLIDKKSENLFKEIIINI